MNLFICTMPILSGDILQEAVRQIVPGVKVGKILIQRDETSIEKLPKLFYKKFPKDIADCFVMLVDPMMATSGLFQTYKFTVCKVQIFWKGHKTLKESSTCFDTTE